MEGTRQNGVCQSVSSQSGKKCKKIVKGEGRLSGVIEKIAKFASNKS